MIEYGWIICPQGGRPGLASAGQAQAMCDTPEGAGVSWPGRPLTASACMMVAGAFAETHTYWTWK